MLNIGLEDRVFPVAKIGIIAEVLRERGVDAAEVLRDVQISAGALTSSGTRVSLGQVLQAYRNALRLVPQADFAYQTGLRFHVSTYGMYGFAILSSTNFRQTMQFAARYHQLATPVVEISFSETKHHGVWTIAPIACPYLDSTLHRFVIEMQVGTMLSLHRDVMGAGFTFSRLELAFDEDTSGKDVTQLPGCHTLYGQTRNRLFFDAAWLETPTSLGNSLTYGTLIPLCETMIEQMDLSAGFSGEVRRALLSNAENDMSLEAIGRCLKTTPRTLRRKLMAEQTTFRELADELRMQLASKYLRDTDLTVEEIAFALKFSDAASFRRAFRRWTGKSPNELRTKRLASD
jgi:AraC-like DNA-binding protein